MHESTCGEEVLPEERGGVRDVMLCYGLLCNERGRGGCGQVTEEADGYQPYLTSPENGLRQLIKRCLDLAKKPGLQCVDEVGGTELPGSHCSTPQGADTSNQ